MIDLHYWTTPNGHKVTMFLEETGLPYKLIPVNIGKGEQFKAEFLAISPNNRIPAMIDHDPPGGGKPISVFESGAMLVYLAEKTGKFLPKEPRARRRDAVAVLADGRARADVRAEQSFQQLCDGQDPVRDGPLSQ
jgi:GST-like protein